MDIDWDDIYQVQAFAMEYTGVSLEDFLNLTPVEFHQVVRFSFLKQSQDDDRLLEKIRWLAWITISPHVKQKISSPSKLIKLNSELDDELSDPDEIRDLYNQTNWD